MCLAFFLAIRPAVPDMLHPQLRRRGRTGGQRWVPCVYVLGRLRGLPHGCKPTVRPQRDPETVHRQD